MVQTPFLSENQTGHKNVAIFVTADNLQAIVKRTSFTDAHVKGFIGYFLVYDGNSCVRLRNPVQMLTQYEVTDPIGIGGWFGIHRVGSPKSKVEAELTGDQALLYGITENLTLVIKYHPFGDVYLYLRRRGSQERIMVFPASVVYSERTVKEFLKLAFYASDLAELEGVQMSDVGIMDVFRAIIGPTTPENGVKTDG